MQQCKNQYNIREPHPRFSGLGDGRGVWGEEGKGSRWEGKRKEEGRGRRGKEGEGEGKEEERSNYREICPPSVNSKIRHRAPIKGLTH